MPIKPGTTDLDDASAPEDVAAILRNAAQKFREPRSELRAAWGDDGAGEEWDEIATKLELLSDSL